MELNFLVGGNSANFAFEISILPSPLPFTLFSTYSISFRSRSISLIPNWSKPSGNPRWWSWFSWRILSRDNCRKENFLWDNNSLPNLSDMEMMLPPVAMILELNDGNCFVIFPSIRFSFRMQRRATSSLWQCQICWLGFILTDKSFIFWGRIILYFSTIYIWLTFYYYLY